MALIKSKIEEEVYKHLIQYLYSCSNIIRFTMQNEFNFKENYHYMCEWFKVLDEDVIEIKHSLPYYIQLQEKELIEEIRKRQQYIQESKNNNKDYFYNVYEIYLNDAIKRILLKANSLEDWKSLHFPEDITFIKDDYIKMQFNTQLNECYLYFESEEEYNKIKNMGIVIYDKYVKELEELQKEESKKFLKKYRSLPF